MTNLPKFLDIGIGGFLGNSYSVRLIEDGSLEYWASESEYTNQKRQFVTPDPNRWDNFRNSLDQIGIWKWLNNYPNIEGIMDGTHWHAEIIYDDKHIKTQGNNNYPKEDFINFMRAVSELLGGKIFE